MEDKKAFTNRSLKVFFIITVAASVLLETMIVVQQAMGLAVFLMWVPALAALAACAVSQKKRNGKVSCKALLQSAGFRRISFRWILISCGIPLLYMGIPYLAFWILFPGSLKPGTASAQQLVIMSFAGIFIGLLTALGEETGWRGYLVPALMERIGVKKALVFTSLFWGAWHLPLLVSGLYMSGTPVWYKVPAFLLMIVPVGILYGLLAIKTRSVWAPAFLHAAHNTFDQTIFGTITTADNKMYFVSETGIFTIVCAWVLMFILYKKWGTEKTTDLSWKT